MRGLVCAITLSVVFRLTSLRSIDQVIEDVESEFKANYSGPMSKFPSRVWFDYTVAGRDEELVKLQLDMIMTKDLWDAVIDTDYALPERGRRNAVRDPTRLWPRKIPYTINEKFAIEDRLKLVMAMDHWEEHTCLEFVEANAVKDSDILQFVPVDYGCESFLGRMQGNQSISLAKPCMYKEIIVHEIGHALGLYHEHMRHDRDDYVNIYYDNINETNHRQFDKLKANQYNQYDKPYDYESVMHYGKLFFSLNRSAELLTIEPKDDAYLDVIGEAPGLSFYDVKIVNDMYTCSEGCLDRSCPGDGFLGKNCQCYCKGQNAYDIVLCEAAENCDSPDISLTDYIVYNENSGKDFQNWDDETFPDGMVLTIEHSDTDKCGLSLSAINCTDGQWQGEPPKCEKACIVEDFTEDYNVTDPLQNEIQPGQKIQSGAEIYVLCRNRKKDVNIVGNPLLCSDGEWESNIASIVCKKEHPLCPMVINAQIAGTFEDGFKISCIEGYDIAPEEVDRFNCSWNGVWEPFTPTCKPANCFIPAVEMEKATGKLTSNGIEVFRGSEVTHGSDVTLVCPKGCVPDKATFSCKYGQFDVGEVPQCVLVHCPKPTVKENIYRPLQTEYQYGDSVTVGRCRQLLVLVGSQHLTCMKDGTWSDTAACEPFCDDGEVIFDPIKNSAIIKDVWYRKHGLPSYEACKQKCLRYRRFLCLAFVFGIERRKRQCRIYRQDPFERPGLIMRKDFWTIGVRKCHRR